MMITMLFYLDFSGKKFCQIILRSISFEQKLLSQVVEVGAEAVKGEAEAVKGEAEAIQKIAASTSLVVTQKFASQ